MNKKFLTIIVAALMLLLLVGVIGAQSGLPGSGYWFGATHQNVGPGNANLVVTAYDSQSNATYPYTPPALASGASINIGPGDIPGLPAGFVGSAVTSADQPVVALVNVTNRESGSNGVPGGKAAAIYNGVDGAVAATEINFPLAKNNFFNKTTTFYLQNAGTAAATIDVVFNFGGTNYLYTTPSISPGQMVAVDPGLASVPSGNANTGAMRATSAVPIAGAMLEHESSVAVGTVLQGSSGFTPGQLNQVAYCPTIKKNFFGRSSGLQVQNTHSAAQDITVEYVASGSSVTSTSPNVQPGASVTFIDDAAISDGLYSAKVSGAAGSVAAIVNESELPLVNANQTSITYNCAGAASASTKVSYPSYKEGFFGRTTALQVQNVGASDATNVVLSFVSDGVTYTSVAQSIAANASNTYVCVSSNATMWAGSSLPDSKLAGVTITADQPIIVVSNEASWATTNPCAANNGSGSFDKASSNGFNLN